MAASALAVMLLACACASDQSRPFPQTPLKMASLQDVQKEIGTYFGCSISDAVPMIALGGSTLDDFQRKNTSGLQLFAITDAGDHVWVSPNGDSAAWGRVISPSEPVTGGRLAGCQAD